ncbi:MAG: S1/P1 nuclease [Gammaproteobacteria bacterium]|nr:S1/P1 nuclease [Gammaproteobacteria bacterium]
MTRFRNYLFVVLLATLTSGFMHNSFAWDAVGHRLSAAIASHYLSDDSKTELLRILAHHPRFQQDFMKRMPASIVRGDNEGRLNWLLGQAAFWPDITRGLPESEREKYNRANWHYIDGAWLRGQADIQGNTYIGISPFEDIAGRSAEDVSAEANVDNIMNALDFNTALLANSQTSMGQRAIALCWVLHLVGDIHQPLHVGSLYSAKQFSRGDRGGNGIDTDGRNLHARWDRALSGGGVNSNLKAVLAQHSTTLKRMDGQDDGNWSLWMKESRALLLNTVYTSEMKSAIARTNRSNQPLREFNLNNDYVATMEYHARMRLALAGRRLAIWFEDNL